MSDHREARSARPMSTGVSEFRKGPLRVVLVVLKEGGRLEKHRALGPMTLQVLSGLIRFRARETCSELGPEQRRRLHVTCWTGRLIGAS